MSLWHVDPQHAGIFSWGEVEVRWSDPSSSFALNREKTWSGYIRGEKTQNNLIGYFLSPILTAWPTSRTVQVLCIAFCCQALSLVSLSVLLARALLKFLSGAGRCQGWSRFVLCSSHDLSLCLGVNKQRGSIFLQTLKSRLLDNYRADLPVTHL